MTKKDPSVTENLDSGSSSDNEKTSGDVQNDPKNSDRDETGFTKVENASASGLGSLGRETEDESS